MQNRPNVPVAGKNAARRGRRRTSLLRPSATPCGEDQHPSESQRLQPNDFLSAHDEFLHSENERGTLGCSLPIVNSCFATARQRVSAGQFPSQRSFPFSSLACYLRRRRGITMSVNKVILVGRLGRDPETRYTGGGQAVANFSLATDESYKDKNGERQKRTEWHKIVVWGQQAEISQPSLKKGSLIFIEGRIQSREWQDKEGQKRTSFEIVANNFRMLGGRAKVLPQ